MKDGIDEQKIKIAAELAEMRRLGSVTYSRWQAYTWKNEASEQRRRILQHLNEILTEQETAHDPMHMMERAIGVLAICLRRLIECRLVTDAFCTSKLAAHEVTRKSTAPVQDIYIGDTGGAFFQNYDLTKRISVSVPPKTLADKLLHARVIGVLQGSAYLDDGLLVASDTQSRQSLFHFTAREFEGLVEAFLSDQVTFMSEGRNPQTGKVEATRE